jgi:hypothetical protein
MASIDRASEEKINEGMALHQNFADQGVRGPHAMLAEAHEGLAAQHEEKAQQHKSQAAHHKKLHKEHVKSLNAKSSGGVQTDTYGTA